MSQTEGHLEFQEGWHVELSCLFETSYSAPTLFWYEQHPQESPQLLVSNYGAQDERASKGWKWTLSTDPKKKFFNLTKKSVELRDSAVYFCAMSDTVKRMLKRAGQKPTWWQVAELLMHGNRTYRRCSSMTFPQYGMGCFKMVVKYCKGGPI